jgi:hypothetical protein
LLFDGRNGHSRRQSSSRYRRAPGWNELPEGKLTRAGGPCRITAPAGTRDRKKPGYGPSS